MENGNISRAATGSALMTKEKKDPKLISKALFSKEQLSYSQLAHKPVILSQTRGESNKPLSLYASEVVISLPNECHQISMVIALGR